MRRGERRLRLSRALRLRRHRPLRGADRRAPRRSRPRHLAHRQLDRAPPGAALHRIPGGTAGSPAELNRRSRFGRAARRPPPLSAVAAGGFDRRGGVNHAISRAFPGAPLMNAVELENRYSARNYHPLPVTLTRGEGAFLWDSEGRRYIDMMSAYSAVSHGHGHPRILAALAAQAQRLAVPSRAYHNDRLGPFLEKLCAVSGFDAALPMNTGAEAVETAIKAARRWAYRVKRVPHDQAEIIVADGNFHGRTTTIIGFSSEDDYRDGFGPFAPGFRAVPLGDHPGNGGGPHRAGPGRGGHHRAAGGMACRCAAPVR